MPRRRRLQLSSINRPTLSSASIAVAAMAIFMSCRSRGAAAAATPLARQIGGGSFTLPTSGRTRVTSTLAFVTLTGRLSHPRTSFHCRSIFTLAAADDGGLPGLAASPTISSTPGPPPSSSSSSSPGRRRPRRTSTGGLKNLPVLLPANELVSQALRNAQRIQIDEDKVKNPRLRAKKLGAQRLDAIMIMLTKPLKEVIKAYEYELGVLHPFEATLADLTVRARVKQGHQTLNEVLDQVNDLRKRVLITGKSYAADVRNATTKAEAIEASEAGIKAIADIMTQEAAVILNLIEVQKSLRKLPIVSLSTPTVVLVGAPNVGKSSIVRAISSGTPEVNDYPFTTRGMTLGHIQYDDFDVKCQVMDTPGVLNRPDDQRNEMEALTLASMQHLPTAVMFVMDLTGNSGALSSIENQIQIRNDLRKRFPKRPWVDVISKADLPMADDDPAVLLAPSDAIHVSVTDKTGIPELSIRVREMLLHIRDLLDIYIGRQQSS